MGLGSLAASLPVGATTVTIGVPADSANAVPFGNPTGSRYQQVYGQTLFPDTITIASITFFHSSLDFSFFPGGSISAGDYGIHLSTTSKAVNNLDATFGNNAGTDDLQVFNGHLGGPISGSEFTIDLTSPFTYDPTLGNLLLDIRLSNLDPANRFFSVFLDARNGTTTDFSRLCNFAVGACSASTGHGFGLVTAFNSNEAVPEPATLLLLGSGLVGLGGAAWRRRNWRWL